MKPIISYYGGKQRIASKIVPYLQSIPHTVRCIPFCGGLGVFYSWDKPVVSNSDHYREIINDKSEHLITLYRWARENPDEFAQMIELTPYSRAEYRRAISILKDENASDKDIAWAYYVNIQQSFAHNLNKGWGTSVISQNQAGTWHNNRLRIPGCLERLQDVHIECDDALSVIERWDSPQTLFYLDPPYPGAHQGHYDGYSLDDWSALCDLLDRIQGSYVLSNYPQDIEPKSAQQRVEINAVMSASGKGKVGKNKDKSKKATTEELGDRTRTEVLWICDRSSGIRDDLSVALSNNLQIKLF